MRFPFALIVDNSEQSIRAIQQVLQQHLHCICIPSFRIAKNDDELDRVKRKSGVDFVVDATTNGAVQMKWSPIPFRELEEKKNNNKFSSSRFPQWVEENPDGAVGLLTSATSGESKIVISTPHALQLQAEETISRLGNDLLPVLGSPIGHAYAINGVVVASLLGVPAIGCSNVEEFVSKGLGMDGRWPNRRRLLWGSPALYSQVLKETNWMGGNSSSSTATATTEKGEISPRSISVSIGGAGGGGERMNVVVNNKTDMNSGRSDLIGEDVLAYSAGCPLPRAVWQAFADLGLRIRANFGSTETGNIAVALEDPFEWQGVLSGSVLAGSGVVARPWGQIKLRELNPEREGLGLDRQHCNELLVHTPWMGLAYLEDGGKMVPIGKPVMDIEKERKQQKQQQQQQQPLETSGQQATISGNSNNDNAQSIRFYATGDAGYVDSDGRLVHAARLRRCIVSPEDESKVLSPMWLEREISRRCVHLPVSEVVAAPLADDSGIVVAVVPKSAAQQVKEELGIDCHRHDIDQQKSSPQQNGNNNPLPLQYTSRVHIVGMDELPRSGAGKIIYRLIAQEGEKMRK